MIFWKHFASHFSQCTKSITLAISTFQTFSAWKNILEFAAFHCGTCTAFSQFQFDLHGIPRRFFFAETFWSLTHFVCLTVVLKLAVTVCISLHFQTFWPKSLKVFSVVSKKFWPMTKKHQIPSLFVSSSRHIYLRLQWNGDGVTRSITG